MIALAGLSQKDSVINGIPRSAIVNAMKAKDSLEIMKLELLLYKRIDFLNSLLQKKDSTIISTYEKLSGTNNRLITNLQMQNSNLTKQQSVTENYSKSLQSVIRAKNWTIIKLTGGSAIVIGGLAYLLLK